MWVIAFWLSALLVGALSITPVDNLPKQAFDVWDKAQHAFGFLGLTVLGLVAHPRHRPQLVAGLLLYGVCIELAQSVSGWRQGDVADWLADAIGIVAGTLLFRPWRTTTGDAQ